MKSADASPRRFRPDVSPLSVAILIAVAPALLGGTRYAYDMAVVAMVYGMFAVSWDLACGTTGELSFGHSFFIGTAGFTAAIVISRFDVPPWAALLTGAGAGALAGLVIGLLTLRHTGPVFTLVTMAAQLTLYRTLFVWGSLFGGEEGIPVRAQWLDEPRYRWFVVAVISFASVVGAKYLLRSSFGLRLRASGGDRRVGQSAGIDVDVTRVQGFTISGFVAGLAGSILVLHNAIANYELTGDQLSGMIFLLSLVGGMGTLVGPWIAAFLCMTLLRELLYAAGQWQSVTSMLVVFVLLWLMPKGVMPEIAKRVRWRPRLAGSRPS
jgi:branched-chain amino acid transport system permease protein